MMGRGQQRLVQGLTGCRRSSQVCGWWIGAAVEALQRAMQQGGCGRGRTSDGGGGPTGGSATGPRPEKQRATGLANLASTASAGWEGVLLEGGDGGASSSTSIAWLRQEK